MTLLISLIIAFLFIGIGHKFVKKNANLCYIIAAVISIILIIFDLYLQKVHFQQLYL